MVWAAASVAAVGKGRAFASTRPATSGKPWRTGLAGRYPMARRALPSKADDRRPFSPPGHLPTPTQVHVRLVPGQGAPLEEKNASRNRAYHSDRLGTRGPGCRADLPTGRLLWQGVEWREENRAEFTVATQHLGDKNPAERRDLPRIDSPS